MFDKGGNHVSIQMLQLVVETSGNIELSPINDVSTF